ncbi:MAG TPA: sialidase family protein [Dermatophilaceae bacterium]|nr:sialidase family protein [Dermatophilaceae bacterium]
MTTGDRQGDGFDPVAELFARERDGVVSEAADDLRWQAIRREARRERRARTARYAAGLAAAVAVVAGGVSVGLGLLGPDTRAPVVAEQSTSGTPLPEVGASTAAARQRSAATSPAERITPTPSSTVTISAGPVPGDTRVTSVSYAGQGVIYALSAASCGTSQCPTLLGSADDGRSWRVVKTFPKAAAPSTGPATAASAPGPVPVPRALSQVRFANPQVGFVFGGGVQLTRDGGRTWREYAHPDDVVLDLETRGGTVYLTTASRCAKDYCEGVYQVSRAPLSADGATAVGTPTELSADGAVARFVAADIDLSGDTPFVTAVPWPAARVLAAQRVDPDGVTRVAADAGGHPVVAVVGSADGSGVVHGVSVAAGKVVLQRSSDGGRTWGSGRQLQLSVPPRSVHFAAATGSDVVGVAGGLPGVAASMVASHDGGRSWPTVRDAPAMDQAGWRWVGAAGGKTYFAVPYAGRAGFWRSDDLGRSWRFVSVR